MSKVYSTDAVSATEFSQKSEIDDKNGRNPINPLAPGGTLNVEVIGMLVGNFFGKS